MRHGLLAATAAAGAMVLATTPANAVVHIDIFQSGANVEVTATGSLDVTGATFIGTSEIFPGIIVPPSSIWFIGLGTSGANDLNTYALTSADASFGTGSGVFSKSSSSGTNFFIDGGSGTPDVGFSGSGAISSQMAIDGVTLSAMGLIDGTYDFFLPNDEIILTIAAPEPSTWALMLAGVAGLGAALRTRRGKLAAA